MQLVILAAGKGTRMRPLTDTVPKPMVPLLGRPKLEYTLDCLPDEIDSVIMVINHLGRQISDYFKDEYKGRKIRYVVQEELNGTGGAVHACKDFLEDEFLVMMGDDIYLEQDISKLMKHSLALLACEVNNPDQFGILLLDDKEHLLDIKERPHNSETNLVNTGLYKLNRKFLDYPLVPVYGGTEYGLPQTLVSMGKDYPIVIEKTQFWKPLGKVEDIQVAEEALKEMLEKKDQVVFA